MTVKKGLSIFLCLTIAVGGAVLLFTADKSSIQVFKSANKYKMLTAFAMVVAVWALDALKFKFLARAAGAKIRFGLALELTWINYFGAAITPMQSGGGPFQMYILYKNGISVGTSVAITIVRTFLTMLLLGMTIPFGLMLKPDIPQMGWAMRGFLFYVLAFILLAWVVVLLSITRPAFVKRICWLCISFLKRLGLFGGTRMTKMFRRASHEIDAYNSNIRAFATTGRNYFLLGLLAAFMQMLTQLSVMPCMIWAMGMEVMYVECVLVQALFLFLLYFIPTPGGSGAAEGGAALVFSLFVPWSVAGILGVAWRLLTEYTGIALGAVVAIKMIGWNVAEEILEMENPDRDAAGDCK